MTDVLVLCYHAISPTWPAVLSTTPERFREQLTWLEGRGYRGVTFTEAVTAPQRGKVVAVTFDDAYRSVGTLARPILDELGWPATVYAPTDWCGTERPMVWPGIDTWLGTEHERELVPLSWDELRGLRDGGWEVGSHTCSHPHLTTLDDEALERELTASRAVCEREMGACTSIAYPYGDVDPRVVEATLAAGYTCAAGLPNRYHEARAFEWPRIGVYQVDDLRRFRLKSSRVVRSVRRRVLRDRPAAERAA
jgi:peptidoglycan/xylan/chitin deacetylase (PgdA/CDA1 family)